MKKRLISLLIPFSMSALAADYSSQIEARQDAYKGIKENVEAVGEMLESGKMDFAVLTSFGERLTQHATSLKTLFPEGSQEGSDAKKVIWEEFDKFSMGLDKLNKGFADFHAGASTQNQSMMLAGFEEATGTCKACHRKYRVKR